GSGQLSAVSDPRRAAAADPRRPKISVSQPPRSALRRIPTIRNPRSAIAPPASAAMPSDHPALPFRIGHGYDIHRTTLDRPLVLGGISFDVPFGLEGHSDADCLTHAICDAILGAAGLPDIGHFFPNTDPAYRGIDSQVLLERTASAVRD